MTVFTGKISKWWYALEPKTLRMLGKAHKLETLVKKFGNKPVYSRQEYLPNNKVRE